MALLHWGSRHSIFSVLDEQRKVFNLQLKCFFDLLALLLVPLQMFIDDLPLTTH
jgi:hypothetical protein